MRHHHVSLRVTCSVTFNALVNVLTKPATYSANTLTSITSVVRHVQIADYEELCERV